MIELPCPESCSYLIEARNIASERESELRQKETAGEPRALRLTDRAYLALDGIQRAIVYAQRGIRSIPFRDLNDADVLAAADIAIKNLETEESGLIYEHRAGSPKISELSRQMRAGVDEVVQDFPPEQRPRAIDVLKALTFLRNSAQAHINRAAGDPEGARSFVRYLTLFYPWPEQATSPLII
jgi:hypothetical protein